MQQNYIAGTANGVIKQFTKY